MKITSGTVNMTSNRSFYSHYEQTHEEAILSESKAATLDFSDESKSYVEQMREGLAEYEKQQKEQAAENERENAKGLLLGKQEKTEKETGLTGKTPQEIRLETMRRILELLNRMRKGKGISLLSLGEISSLKEQLKAPKAGGQTEGSAGMAIGRSGTAVSEGTAPSRTFTWKRVSVTSAFYAETENTAYQAQGKVRTADGRELDFQITAEMSRAFCEKYDSYLEESYVCVDPLVINLDSNIASVSDQKFLFDLDADGNQEEISFAGQGSGFLALDKNQDGVINDGSELFGTRSGDGFADLAAYDKDGNGWIDESDEVFSDLRIWMKDEDGNDRLLTLKEANVGAIYLGKASTQFSLQEESHQTNGVIRSTGIYLKETGEAGTIQHIDLTI